MPSAMKQFEETLLCPDEESSCKKLIILSLIASHSIGSFVGKSLKEIWQTSDISRHILNYHLELDY